MSRKRIYHELLRVQEQTLIFLRELNLLDSCIIDMPRYIIDFHAGDRIELMIDRALPNEILRHLAERLAAVSSTMIVIMPCLAEHARDE